MSDWEKVDNGYRKTVKGVTFVVRRVDNEDFGHPPSFEGEVIPEKVWEADVSFTLDVNVKVGAEVSIETFDELKNGISEFLSEFTEDFALEDALSGLTAPSEEGQ